MFYLPRICEHCLNPSCAASCPSGAIYKREEDGIVLVDQDRCRGWRMCVSGCPYKKVYFNHRTGKAEKCTFCFPRIEVGLPTVCSETCVGRLRYIGLMLYDADKVLEAASTTDDHGLYEAQRDVFLDPYDPEVDPRGGEGRHRAGLDRRRAALARSTRSSTPTRSRCHCTRSTAPCRWSGTSRRCHRSSTWSARPGRTRRTRATCSPPSTRCASRSSTSPSSSPPATSRRSTRCSRSSPRCAPTCATSTWAATPTARSPRPSGMSEEDMYDMYRLLAIAKYDERYVIPPAHAEQAHSLEELATECSVSEYGGGQQDALRRGLRRADADRGRELPDAAGPADLRLARRPRPTRRPGSTCSTGTARAPRPGCSPRRGPDA